MRNFYRTRWYEWIFLSLITIVGAKIAYGGAHDWFFQGGDIDWFDLIMGCLLCYFGLDEMRCAFSLRKAGKKEEQEVRAYREEKERKALAEMRETSEMLEGISCEECGSTWFCIRGEIGFDTAKKYVVTGAYLRRNPVIAECADCEHPVDDESVQDLMFDAVSRAKGLLEAFGYERLKPLKWALEEESEVSA